MDKLLDNQTIFARNVSALLKYIFDTGFLCTLGEAYRTPEQARWNADHGSGIVNSLHCERLAIDLNLFSASGEYFKTDQQYKQIGDYWKKLNAKNRWGGDFQREDGNHFEMQNI
jgi:hypothetical protein